MVNENNPARFSYTGVWDKLVVLIKRYKRLVFCLVEVHCKRLQSYRFV